MNKVVRLRMATVSILGMILASGCATTNRGKTVQTALIAGAAGVLYGQTQSQYKTQNSVMYGSIAAATAAIVGLYVFDEEKRAEEFRQQAMHLQTKLDGSGQAYDPRTADPQLQGRSTFSESDLPGEYQHLIRPGSWRLYEINRWVKKSKNRLVLESKLLEFMPPSIQPGNDVSE